MTVQIVPESAPFSAEQRAWLNGFFAGVLGVLDQQSAQGGSVATLAAAASLLPPSLGAGLPVTQETDESYPWHDPAIPLTERIEMTKGMPQERRMMAAMAQLNCGSCGYLCKTYSLAIASGAEKNLTLCTPGGSETAKALRILVKESTTQITPFAKEAGLTTKPSPASHGTRDNPLPAKLVSCDKLNSPESTKDTRHIVIDLAETGIGYRVGDALGIWPTNCNTLINKVIETASLDSSAAVTLSKKCLRTITHELIEVVIENVRSRPKVNGAVAMDSELIVRLEVFEESDEFYDWDVLEFFEAFPSVGLGTLQVLGALADLRPRLYSIASSQSRYPAQVHLTVGRVENWVRNRERKGVTSTMLADRLSLGSTVHVFVQPSHGFTIPSDPNKPMIMVGPGTGIAPFMAFLQQREADKAKGQNWLFFGDQRSSADFLYRKQLETWQNTGLLTNLDLAFSRDTASKIYVQHRMKERGAELFHWLESGAYFFVCGDASRMAVDVNKALQELIVEHGNRSEFEAKKYLESMLEEKRYVRDVY